eukprot:10393150-Heterocapsa_arctica.AAC.1
MSVEAPVSKIGASVSRIGASVSKIGTSVPRIVLDLHGMLGLHVTVGGCGRVLRSNAVSQPRSST